MRMSVLIPVHNERHSLGDILNVVARTLPNVKKEIVVDDDCSKDGTRGWLHDNFPDGPGNGSSVDLDSDGNVCLAKN